LVPHSRIVEISRLKAKKRVAAPTHDDGLRVLPPYRHARHAKQWNCRDRKRWTARPPPEPQRISGASAEGAGPRNAEQLSPGWRPRQRPEPWVRKLLRDEPCRGEAASSFQRIWLKSPASEVTVWGCPLNPVRNAGATSHCSGVTVMRRSNASVLSASMGSPK